MDALPSPNSPDPRPPDDTAGETPRSGAAAETPGDAGFDLDTIWSIIHAHEDPTRTDPLIGRQLGGASLLRVLGEGGMARVYEGRQTFTKQSVAVKVQKPERLNSDHAKRFLRELEILASLHHPAICRLHTAGILEEGSARSVWFIMDLVPDATPITDHAAQLPLRDRVSLFCEVCEAVAAGHAQGIAHRDLKPRNILVGSDRLPKVIDFGVARATGAVPFATSLTHTGQLLGTLQYMPPEALGNSSEADSIRGDIWSLGIILHELIVGSPPFDAADVPLPLAIDRIRAHRPCLASHVGSGVPKALATIVDRCLEPAPSRRFPDAAALSAALGDLLAVDANWQEAVEAREFPSRFPKRVLSRRRLAAVGLATLGAIPVVASLAPAIAGRKQFRPGAPIQNPSPTSLAGTGPHAPLYTFRPSPIQRPDFSFSFRTVFFPGADTPLVEQFNVRRLQEEFYQRISYWCPEKDDLVGRLVFRFDFPAPSTRIFLAAGTSCYDYRRMHNGDNRGTSALDLSTDGETWTTLRDDLDRDAWGEEWTIDELLPEWCLGTSSLWIQVRLLSTNSSPSANYALAQFGRAPEEVGGDTFRIEAACDH